MATSSRTSRLMILIVLATLGATAFFAAQGVGTLGAGIFLPLDAHALAPPPPAEPRPQPRQAVSPNDLLAQNIFDHQTGPLWPPRLEAMEEQEETAEDIEMMEWVDGMELPALCDGSMRLVGTFVHYRDPEDSFATITDSTGSALLYREGMEVDERSILAVRRNFAVLRPATGELCSLRMFDEAPRVATSAAPTPRAERPTRSRPLRSGLDPEELERGIQQVSDREYAIDRSLVDQLLANQAALMRTARVIPHEENGTVVGVKLYGIRRSSLLGRLGIQNGDMLRTINGYDMSAPDSALEAYARLRGADRITINFVRRGQAQTLDYNIR
jgi:general secretion pathway protein C